MAFGPADCLVDERFTAGQSYAPRLSVTFEKLGVAEVADDNGLIFNGIHAGAKCAAFEIGFTSRMQLGAVLDRRELPLPPRQPVFDFPFSSGGLVYAQRHCRLPA
jgi:hypothetical protein